MLSARFALLLVTAATAATVSLMPSRFARAQSSEGSSLAAAIPRVIPWHHRQFYFSNGTYIGAFQLNPSIDGLNDNRPETVVFVPPSLIPSVKNGPAGVTRMNWQVRQLANGVTSYQFTFQVKGTFTQFWNAATLQEVAQGLSDLTGQAYWESKPPVPEDDVNFSALGPPFHRAAGDARYSGVDLRTFSLHLDGQGSSPSFQWSLNGQQKNKIGLLFIAFNIIPR